MNETAPAVWLVTGAAGALGAAMVRRLIASGDDCIALDRDSGALDALHDELAAAHGRSPALMPMDLAGAGPEDHERLAEAIEGQFGRLEYLVHNAAVFHALRPLLHQQPGEWLEIVQTSLSAPYMLSSVLVPLMPASGRIVFIEDGHCFDQPASWGAYGVAQAGRRQMAAALAAERTESGPGVVVIDPGPFYSALRVAAWPSDSPDNLPAPDEAADRVLAAIGAPSTRHEEEA